MSEDEVSRRHRAGFFSWAEALGLRHLGLETRRDA
jgi:hypothetical protein